MITGPSTYFPTAPTEAFAFWITICLFARASNEHAGVFCSAAVGQVTAREEKVGSLGPTMLLTARSSSLAVDPITSRTCCWPVSRCSAEASVPLRKHPKFLPADELTQ